MSASHPDRDVGVQLSMALVALASLIVPARSRPDWRREWEAEVWHRWDRIKQWGAVDGRTRVRLWSACSGAFADALCMRSHAATGSAFLADVRFGVRMLAEGPRAALDDGFRLALALSVTSSLLAVAVPFFLRPTAVSSQGSLVMIRNTCSAVEKASLPVSAPEYDVLRGQSQALSDAAAIYVRSGVATYAGANGPARIAAVSPNFFDVLGAAPMVGDVSTIGIGSGGGPRVAVLGYRFWQTRFDGDTGIIGREISVGDGPLTIVAVMPMEFECPGNPDLLRPRDPSEAPQAAGGTDARFLDVVGRLRPDVSVATAQSLISDRVGRPNPAVLSDSAIPHWGVSVVPFERALQPDAVARMLALLCCAAILAALASLGGPGRFPDAVDGQVATRASMVRPHVVRGLAVSLIAACGGLGVTYLVMPLVKSAADRIAPGASVGIDGRVVLVTGVCALVCGVALGVTSTVSCKAASRRILAAARIGLVVLLAAGSTTLVFDTIRLNAVETGMDAADQVTYRLALDTADGNLLSNYDASLARARNMHGVQLAAAVDILPLDRGSSDRSLVVEGMSGRIPADHECRSVSPAYFDVMHIPVIAGRPFRSSDRPDVPAVAVVNEAFASRYWPGMSAIGRRIRLSTAGGAPWRTVVGVVGNVRQTGLDVEPLPEVYCPFPQLPTRSIAIVAAASDAEWPSIGTDVALVEGSRLSADVRRFKDIADQSMAPRVVFSLLVALSTIAAFVLVLPIAPRLGGRRAHN